jgi:hypothetical protein
MENALIHGAVCGATRTLDAIALGPQQTAALLLVVISVVSLRLLWLESAAAREARAEDGTGAQDTPA